MATKSKLEQAVDRRAATLGDAQRELVLSQFSVYKQNKQRLADLKDRMVAIDSFRTASLEEVRFKQAQRASFAYEKNQLETANSKIAADLFELLKEE